MERVGAEIDLGQPIDIGVPNVLVTVLGFCKAGNGWLQEIRAQRRDHGASIRRDEEAPLTRISERDVRLCPFGTPDNGQSLSPNAVLNVELERMESEAL